MLSITYTYLVPVQHIPATFRKCFISGKALPYEGLGHHRRNCDFHYANPMNASFQSKFFDEVRQIELRTIAFISEEKW